MMAKRRLSPGNASLLFAGIALFELVPLDRDFQVYLPQSRIEDLHPAMPSIAGLAGGGRIFPGGNEFVPLGLRSVMGYHAARTRAADEMLDRVASGGLLEARSSAFTVFMEQGQAVPYEAVAGMMIDNLAESGTTSSGIPAIPSEPMPRAFMAGGWVLSGEPGAADLFHTVIPEQITVLSSDPGIPRSAGSMREAAIVTDEPELVEIRTDSDAPGILVLADTWHPRWIVTIDGAGAELLEANGWMRAVAVPAGSHLVRFSYDTSDFRTGLVTSLAASILVLVSGILEALRRRRTATLET
jgi:hypothetical protein